LNGANIYEEKAVSEKQGLQEKAFSLRNKNDVPNLGIKA